MHSSSAEGNTFGTRAPPSAKQQRGLSPNGCTWRSTPSGAAALHPTCKTILPTRPPSLRVSRREKDGLLQSKGNTICVLDRVRESAPPRPKMT